MFIVAIVSQKGGVGKSTLSVNLAGQYAMSTGHKTLLIDMDSQGSSLVWAEMRGELPPDADAGHPVSLPRMIKTATSQGYQIAFIDTDPRSKEPSLAAARAADLVLIPVRPNLFDLAALTSTLDLCALAKAKAVVVLSAAPTFKGREAIVADATQVAVSKGAVVCPVTIHERAAYAHSLIEGKTVGEHSPRSEAAREIERLLAWTLDAIKAPDHHSTITA